MKEIKTMLFGKFRKKKYTYIMSVGQGCITVEILRDNKLRRKAGPLDWTFADNYNATINVLKNKFRDYFNKEDIKSNGDITRSNTLVHFNIRNNIQHPHAFPLKENFDFNEAYKTAYETYNRRIRYFLNFLSEKKSKICLIYIERAYDWEYKVTQSTQTKITNEIIQQNIMELNDIYGKKCFDIIYIKHDSDLKMNEYKTDKRIIYVNNTCIDEKEPHKGNSPMLTKIIKDRVGLELNITFEKIINLFIKVGCVMGIIITIKRLIHPE